MDVDGSELDILKSSIKLLKKNNPIIFMEYAPYIMKEHGSNVREFMKFLYKSWESLFSSFILFIPVSLFQYLFEPLPQRISSFMDIALFFENLIRLYLIYNTIVSFKKIKNAQFGILIFSYYILIELIWSLGVNNWGTASRHHIPSSGLLALCAFMYHFKSGNSLVNYGNKYKGS